MVIHILHVLTSLGRGGAERHIVDLAANMDRDEFRHTVCYLRPPDTLAAEMRAVGVAVIGLELPGKHPFLSAATRLLPILRSHRPDVIHTETYDADISARLVRLAGNRTPIVTSIGNLAYEPEMVAMAGWSPTKVAVLRSLDWLSARWSTPQFVAVSHFVERSAIKRLKVPPARIRTIYNAVNPDALHCAPDQSSQLRQSLGIPERGFVYLTVGRVDPPKGHRHLLHAFARLVASQPDAYLVVVGDGPSVGEVHRLAGELGIAERMRMPGSRADVGVFLEMADVFVFPTVFEGFGLALVEAMFKALPCVASRIGPLPELITDGETGLLVPPGVSDELAAGMANLYNDPARRRAMGAAAQQDASRRFHIQVLAPQWEQLYRELARREGEATRCN